MDFYFRSIKQAEKNKILCNLLFFFSVTLLFHWIVIDGHNCRVCSQTMNICNEFIYVNTVDTVTPAYCHNLYWDLGLTLSVCKCYVMLQKYVFPYLFHLL